MSAIVSQGISFAELSKLDQSLSRPKRFLGLSDTHLDENELEGMMTDSAIAGTPPLVGSDSGDDSDLLMVPSSFDSAPSSPSPISSSPCAFHPTSILHRKRKDSQEHPCGFAKGAQGRRPTVSFDLLDSLEPPSASLGSVMTLEPNSRARHHDDDDKGPLGPLSPSLQIDFERSLSLNTSKASLSVPQDNACSPVSPPILEDILTQVAPADMLVALFDRSTELEALAALHSDFFHLMYSSINHGTRASFKTLLFKPRESLCDLDWMHAIEDHFQGLPYILERFKGIVGWIGPDSENQEDALWGEDEYGYRDASFDNVQIKWLRDFPQVVEDLKDLYPQFFINARDKLQGRRMSHGGDQRDQFVIFCETLRMSRQELACDNAWTRRMNGCLEKNPDLLLQLKEIVAYEVGYDD